MPVHLLLIAPFYRDTLRAITDTHRTIQDKLLEEKRLKLQEQLARLQIQHERTIHNQNLEFQRQQIEEEKKLQKELAKYNRETQLLIADSYRESILQQVEGREIYANWPLYIYPRQILSQRLAPEPVPLKILIIPPEGVPEKSPEANQPESSVGERTLAIELRHFLQKHYSTQDPGRPTQLLDGSWKGGRYRGGAAIKALHTLLKSEPLLVLDMEIDDNQMVHLSVAYWGYGQDYYYYHEISTSNISYQKLLQESAKRRALQWQKERATLPEDVNLTQVNAIGEKNIDILTLNEKRENSGIKPSNYITDAEDYVVVNRILATILSLVTAGFADAHHLIHTAHPETVPPLLPELLPLLIEDSLTRQILQPFIKPLISHYLAVYEALKEEQPYLLPYLALQLAESLSQWRDKSLANEYVEHALKLYLESRGIPEPANDQLLDLTMNTLSIHDVQDEEYVSLLKKCLINLEQNANVSKLEAWENTLTRKLLDRDLKRDTGGPTLYGSY